MYDAHDMYNMTKKYYSKMKKEQVNKNQKLFLLVENKKKTCVKDILHFFRCVLLSTNTGSTTARYPQFCRPGAPNARTLENLLSITNLTQQPTVKMLMNAAI